LFFFFSSRRRHTRSKRDWSSDVCSSDLFHFIMNIPVSSPILLQSDEPDVLEEGAADISGFGFFDQPEFLAEGVPDGDDHPASGCELAGKCGRDLTAGGCDLAPVRRGLCFPSAAAVAEMEMDIGISLRIKSLVRHLVKRLYPFNCVDVFCEFCQKGGLEAGPRADFEHFAVIFKLQVQCHVQDERRLGYGLAV